MFRDITKHPLVLSQSHTIEHMAAQLGAAQQRIADLEQQLSEKDRFWLDRVREVEDWGRAASLDQLRGMHPTAAMELHVPEGPRKLYRTDPTGMIVDEVDPRDYDEA